MTRRPGPFLAAAALLLLHPTSRAEDSPPTGSPAPTSAIPRPTPLAGEGSPALDWPADARRLLPRGAPTRIHVGRAEIGEECRTFFSIPNTTQVSWALERMELRDPVPGLSVSVDQSMASPGESLKVTVSWAPLAEEGFETRLAVRLTHGVIPVVLVGEGPHDPAPGDLSFPQRFGGRGVLPSPGAPREEKGNALYGSLNKHVIDRYVKSRLSEVRSCHEVPRQRNPKLFGKVVIQFVIAGDGSVPYSVVASTSFLDTEVGECAAEVIGALQFPEPKGGGVVVVRYPFVFNAGG